MEKKFNYLLIFVMVVLFAQCSKEDGLVNENLSDTSVSKEVVSKNGRLVFKDSTALFNHVNWLIENQNNPNVIEEFNKKLGVVSLNSVFQKGLDIKDKGAFEAYKQKYPNAFVTEYYDNSELIDLPCPNVISYIANDQGIYQVGNIVSKVIKNTIINEPYINELTIDRLEKRNDINGLKLTISQKYYRTAYRDKKKKYRLVARVKLYGYGNGWNIYDGTSTTQRKRLGTWLRSDLSGEVRVTWSYKKYFKDANGVAHTEYNNGTKGDRKAHVSTTVFSYNHRDNSRVVDISRSWCKIVHYGADQSITIDNLFTTH